MKRKSNRKSLVLRLRAVRKSIADLDAALDNIIRDFEDSDIEIRETRGVDGETAAQRVIETRRSLGLTQLQLSRRAGIGPSQLCKIEHGTSDVSAKTARRLASALGVSYSWLLCGQ